MVECPKGHGLSIVNYDDIIKKSKQHNHSYQFGYICDICCHSPNEFDTWIHCNECDDKYNLYVDLCYNCWINKGDGDNKNIKCADCKSKELDIIFAGGVRGYQWFTCDICDKKHNFSKKNKKITTHYWYSCMKTKKCQFDVCRKCFFEMNN